MFKLPLGFEAGIDTADPLHYMLLAEGSEHEAEALASATTSQRESVLVHNAVEQQEDRETNGLRVRASNRKPGPCITVYRRG